MSPVNSDDSSGRNLRGTGRPLTRKEIRAREKSRTADAADLVPEQAYESGNDAPDAPDVPERSPSVPAQPRLEPTVSGVLPGAAASPVPSPDSVAPTLGVPLVPPVPPTIQEPSIQEPASQAPASDAPSEGAHGVHADPGHHADHHAAAHRAAAHRAAAGDAADYTHSDHTHSDHGQADPAQTGHDAVHHAGAGYADDGFGAPAIHADEAYHHAAPADVDYAAYHHDVHHESYEDHVPYEDEAMGHQLLASRQGATPVPRPSKKVRRRRRLVALLLTLALFVTATVVGAQFLKPLLGTDKPSDYPGPGTGQVKLSVQPGEGPVSVAAKLEEARVVANADTFISALSASGGTLSPGEYDFKQEMKNSDAVAVLLNEGQAKVMYFALSAGLRINESLEAISEGSGIPVGQLKSLSDSPQQFGLPAKAKNLEGYLAPGEHRFPVGSTPKDILTQLVKITQDELKAQGVTDPAKQYEVVTVASIVQAEGGQAEYKDVAGAIYNRLKPNNTETAGLIQSDATVTYGLGRKSFHITEEEKADKSNPYNTYAIQGLPVGPIGSPGKTAIDASAKPNKNEYMYWVTINLDTKETKFSKTLAEHQRYVDQYNAWCEANPGRCV
ncbi:endolytic transglycosylase MltG [Arthrobacter sp. NPDC093139]|uniref:endolytic transglycosylase MltG n=1 Tax=Arthrobacter sp. NPDC093139 TaxID=3363945 RepID=UPI00380877B3